MIEFLSSMITGHITITDPETKEVVVDKNNAIHFGNISTEIAQAMTGKSDSFITYMVFGNGGVIIDTAGNITYRDPNTGINKTSTAQLYNSTLVYEMSNNATGGTDNEVSVPGDSTANYEDVLSVVTLEPGFPQIDTNTEEATSENSFVFNEIALYTGTVGFGAQTEVDGVQAFIDREDTTLITHVIFHPVQKAINRTLEITYTLRIQMGE